MMNKLFSSQDDDIAGLSPLFHPRCGVLSHYYQYQYRQYRQQNVKELSHNCACVIVDKNIGYSHGGRAFNAAIALLLTRCRYYASVAPTKDNQAAKGGSPKKTQRPKNEMNKRARSVHIPSTIPRDSVAILSSQPTQVIIYRRRYVSGWPLGKQTYMISLILSFSCTICCHGPALQSPKPPSPKKTPYPFVSLRDCQVPSIFFVQAGATGVNTERAVEQIQLPCAYNQLRT